MGEQGRRHGHVIAPRATGGDGVGGGRVGNRLVSGPLAQPDGVGQGLAGRGGQAGDVGEDESLHGLFPGRADKLGGEVLKKIRGTGGHLRNGQGEFTHGAVQEWMAGRGGAPAVPEPHPRVRAKARARNVSASYPSGRTGMKRTADSALLHLHEISIP